MSICFISGLPRSGSTLLANVLAQNPRFQIRGTSGLMDVLLCVRNSWDQQTLLKSMPPEESEAAKVRVLRSILLSYHEPHEGIAFNRSRSWLAHLEMVELLLGGKAKVLVTVRDVRDVLASYERIWRKTSATRQTSYEADNYPKYQSCAGRCALWMEPEGLVGMSYARIVDAVLRGFRDRMYVVYHERFTREPWGVLCEIHDFLGERPFDYDLDHITQTTVENDLVYGLPGLHDIRPGRIEPSVSRWQEVLGVAGQQYGHLNEALGYQGEFLR